MIAGLPQRPPQYNPLLNPRAALARRNEVLQAMKQQGDITASEYQDAVSQDLGLHPGHKYNRISQPYIFDLVKQELQDRYGVNTVQNGGLKVYTTIQPRLQAAAQSAVDSCSVCYSGGGPASALASVDPSNGEIVALTSTQRYSESSQFNFAAHAQRQPGSSFKVYDLTAAIKQGIDPDSTYHNGSSPITLETPGGSNLDGQQRRARRRHDGAHPGDLGLGQCDLRPARPRRRSRQLAKTAYAMGITSPLGIKGSREFPCKVGPNCFIPPADAIGGLSVGVTPLEQADAYATLANGGVHHDATAIDRVVFPNGKVDEPSAEEGKRVLTEGEAYEVTKVLEGVITSGTGAGYTSIGCSSEAGKTGTSEGLSDAWFVGYTPMYSTAVWTGHPLSRDYTGFGGPTSGPIWRSYMEAAQGGDCPTSRFPRACRACRRSTGSTRRRRDTPAPAMARRPRPTRPTHNANLGQDVRKPPAPFGRQVPTTQMAAAGSCGLRSRLRGPCGVAHPLPIRRGQVLRGELLGPRFAHRSPPQSVLAGRLDPPSLHRGALRPFFLRAGWIRGPCLRRAVLVRASGASGSRAICGLARLPDRPPFHQ